MSLSRDITVCSNTCGLWPSKASKPKVNFGDDATPLPHALMIILIMQNFNFLSLSAGSNGLKADNNNNNKIGSRLEPLSKLQMPYFQSLAQQHGVVMPIPVAQSQYASTSFLDQLSVAGPQVLNISFVARATLLKYH